MSQEASGKKLGYWARFLEESVLLREYLRKYRRFIALGLVSLVVLDVLEILPPLLVKWAVDAATGQGPVNAIPWIALGYFATAIVQAACRYGWRIYLIRSSIFAGRDLRNRFIDKLFGLGPSFFDRHRVGDLMSLSTSDIEAVRQELGVGILVLADALFYFLTVPIAMYLLSPELTLLAFLPLPIIPLLVRRNEREVHHRFQVVQETLSSLSAMVQESLSGIRVIKAFAKEDTAIARFARLGRELGARSMHLARVQTAFGPTLDFTMSLGLVLLLFIGGHGMVSDPASAVTLGTFIAFQRYIQKMVWPMAAVGMAITYYQRSVTSSRRLRAVLERSSDVCDRVVSRLPEGAAGAGKGWRTPGRVEFRNLSFRFPGAERDVLRNITLAIEPGERVAFVGTIGAGKSALLSLLPRLYPVGEGMLLIDGVDVNHWPLAELRRQVGFVSQDVFLFSESVSENVAFGLEAPGGLGATGEWLEEVGDPATIEQATQLAAVHEDVIGLSASYQTRLGERGVNLSGGQKQRLSIARALARQPSILVLDDALSSVDVQTEERILRGLRARGGRNTEIIAAHRISTIRDADRIVVLEQGEVRQVGTHQELVADRRGAYRRYYEEQRLKEDLDQYAERIEAGETGRNLP